MLSAFSTKEALEKCQAADIPAVSVLDPADVAYDEHVVATGSVQEKLHPVIGRIRTARQGATFNGEVEYEPSPAPTYCEHTDELLKEIGFTLEQISDLRSAGVIS